MGIKIKIVYDNKERDLFVEENKRLYDILIENNINFVAPCGGNSKCGKCKVKIHGEFTISDLDYKMLSSEEISSGIRLACTSFINRECTVEVLDSEVRSIVSDYNINKNINIEFKKSSIFLERDWYNNGSLIEVIIYKLSIDLDIIINNYSLDLVRQASTILEHILDREGIYVYVITKGDSISYIGLCECTIYGIAIDIGTTTIVSSLVDMESGELVDIYSMTNSQAIFGQDVISRITSQYKNKNGLNKYILYDINKSIQYLCDKNNIDRLMHIVVSGNTTMVYSLLGLSCISLGTYPFVLTSTSFLDLQAREVLKQDYIAILSIVPPISAFIGGDIVSGIIANGMHKKEEISLFIDLGTNGEIVIGNNEKMIATSTATGPAFEGGNISCGTYCRSGAIDSVYIKDKKLEYTTIGDEKAIGICGSGVIDIVSVLLNNEYIDSSGKIISNNDIKICEGMYFTQEDIRNVQLAKAAIFTSIDMIIAKYACKENDIACVYISGGFSKIDIGNAINIGILKNSFKDKIIFLGNSSLGGAISYLLDKDLDRDKDFIKNNIQVINQNDYDLYEESFIDNLNFEIKKK